MADEVLKPVNLNLRSRKQLAAGSRGKSSLWVIRIIIYRFENKNKSQGEMCVCVCVCVCFNRLFKKAILVSQYSDFL